jgi:transcriptional regulator with XRE-family HTH domain
MLNAVLLGFIWAQRLGTSGIWTVISASQIRAARAIIGAKQRELARAAGISLATLNNIERGVGDPRTSTLEAIEQSLARAGVLIAGDKSTETVTLHRLARPSAYDTYYASQRVLQAMGPDSLLKTHHVLFFARWGGRDAPERPRICLLIEGPARAVLFDQVDFNLGGGARTAEVAGIMLAAFAFHRKELYYLEDVLEDTTLAEPAEAVERIRAMSAKALRHPRDFIDVFDSWDDRLAASVARPGHPMRDLAALFVD